ncbi:MAG: biotin--[acetyl-CoA-carboxylase] ligase [Chlamydiales bacterium]|nr:biotin--[acetyl-CoA-carboxylase] ligase [Chlamydiales bacterium]
MRKNIYYLHFDTIDSTNTWAKKNAETLDPDHLTCITALEQTAGRGRFKRSWTSGRAQNITATLFFTLPKESTILSNIGQILSLSCALVLEKRGFSPQIKWPNDLLLSGKKVAGILCETVTLEKRLAIALGIGINVNMTEELLETIDQPATSLAQLSGHTWDLEQILEPVLKQFLIDLELLEKKGFSAFQEAYQARLAFAGQTITCADGMQNTRGTCHSVRDDGRLNLLLPNGSMTTVSAGEIF